VLSVCFVIFNMCLSTLGAYHGQANEHIVCQVEVEII
jgi:hypothetical protein